MRDTLRVQLWPLPTLGIALAVIAGVGLPLLDERFQSDMPSWLRTYLYSGTSDAARSVLEAIAGSLVTVTALTFSLTVLTLQLASSQFSPRLLRTFTSDRYVQATLALFLATFTFALTVLRSVRTGEDGRTEFVPQVSVTAALVLTLASLLALVLFLSHLAREIRIETMMNSVHSDADRTLQRLLPENPQRLLPEGRKSSGKPQAPENRQPHSGGPAGGTAPAAPPPPPAPAAPPEPPANALVLPAGTSGFLTHVDEAALLNTAIETDAVVLIDRHPGSSLIAGTPMGAAWPDSGEPFSAGTRTRLAEEVSRAVRTGTERTDLQDIAFGLRQLTDIAAKALSPGINDPTTAVHALSHSSALLCEMVRRDLGPRLLRDDDQRVRVVLRRPDLSELLGLAVDQPMRYGAGEPAVLARVAQLLRELAWCGAPAQHPPITAALARLRSAIGSEDRDAAERHRLTRLTESVDEALAGRWAPGRGH
ncbi:DUF2254 domain-containing protein [Streptomyces pacificus]|uniref:DUF2254 domain-containing protein n=1 Tax=Streptomyces pacificus TaxID=2705029 RepID=A0A6A0ASF8_9ACTN|nr:DUF2254 domain-containing protein [Streptomyces pacificus]GFH35772.1 DUF2254 domain-containing protein [Streptomyces pacificus]